ncbi:MAG TPA: Nramp family divalent metal transporter [Chryseosolibacter sp.]|nr:Nramp family divalent metal transporter [Chryseosolibacter sp.]
MPENNYLISEDRTMNPPETFMQRLRFLGPGFILSASIVGSGELIATTTLGAKAGYVAFWVIIVSCLVKVVVQLEVGKHTILTGETAMKIFDRLPGPRLSRARWTVWTVFFLLALKVVQLGGMLGSSAIVLNMLFGVPVFYWVVICAVVVALLIFRGYYNIVEKASFVMIFMFTLLTITSVVALSFTPYEISWSEIASGLTFDLPEEVVAVAIGAFGITGVASDEIISYNYWCIEKGYAAYTGPYKDNPEWRRRAQGWINVMYLDAFVAMVIYTAVTAAFYLLGAAILNDRGVVPGGNQLIETVALIYTESLGTGVRNVYLVGAFFVLFSSVFASLAAWTRIYSDIFGQIGWIDLRSDARRKRVIAILSWTFPSIWALTYMFIELPVFMILFGGAVGSVLLFLIVFAAIHIRYYRHSRIESEGRLYNFAFWISTISIALVGIYGLWSLF